MGRGSGRPARTSLPPMSLPNLLPAAQTELTEAMNWYEDREPGLGIAIADAGHQDAGRHQDDVPGGAIASCGRGRRFPHGWRRSTEWGRSGPQIRPGLRLEGGADP